MPPFLALLMWFVLLVALLSLDPAKEPGIATALWVPLIWMFILGSRLPAQWFGNEGMGSVEVYQEGNPLDRAVFFILIALAIGILISRSFKWREFFSHNIALLAFLAFGLVSVVWSDFPFIAFKRWFRDLGIYLMVLVVLSDPRPQEALRTLLRRLCYLLIPLSVLLIKYYPQIGRSYDEWTGAAAYSGVTTSKDMLGVVCMISGIFFLWDTITRWPSRKEKRTKRIIFLNFAFMAMTLWLLNLASCATCKVCLALGCLVIAMARSNWSVRHPTLFKVLIPLSLCVGPAVIFGFDLVGEAAGAVGRDPTFTDRTLVWSDLLSMKIDRIFGTGYESFWLGPRLQQIWSKWAFHPNQAHNGYIEVYLNLGIVGLFFLALLLIASYRTICKRLTPSSKLASLGMALWIILLIDNVTSASFGKDDLLWITFLLVSIASPQLVEVGEHTATASENMDVKNRFLFRALETTSQRR